MSEAKPRQKNWGLTAGMGAAIVVWQVYDIASATEAQPATLLALQYLLIAGGLIGAAGGLIMWMKGGAGAQ